MSQEPNSLADCQYNSHSNVTESSNNSFENEFTILRNAIQKGNFERAIQSFVLLHSNSIQNPTFQAYLIQLAENIDPAKDNEASSTRLFFASLPCLLQSNIIDFATERLEGKESMRAFMILFDYIQAYPRHAYKYLIGAINLLILCAQALKGDERQKCISLLVTELFPRLCKQRLFLVRKDKVPSIKSTESKHFITLPYDLFEQFLLLGQRFYIKKHQWNDATKFTCSMLSACGYSGLEQLDSVTHITQFEYLREHRDSVRIDDDINENGDTHMLPTTEDLTIISTLMCEYMAATSQFVRFGYDYYQYVCGTDSASNNTLEKFCLIPVCSFQPTNGYPHQRFGQKRGQDKNNNEERTTLDFSDDVISTAGSNSKRPRLDNINNDTNSDNDDDDEVDRSKGLDSYCVKGVDDALQILSKAGDCLRHIVELWQWASNKISHKPLIEQLGGWEQELCRVIDGYKLPFDMHNAVLLVRSDLALSSPSVPGNLAKALELSQTICDRIEVQRRQEKTDYSRSSIDMDIPFMFAFRVLYSIGIIYLLVGSLQQSTLEIAIILSVFPIPNGLDEYDFVTDETDCRTVANIFHGREFGLMRVTQEGLVVRCIKHLIVSLDNESEQRVGMASIDSALRWDEKAGNMIVLMQYGWPYWSNRTNLWHKIIKRIGDKRVFKNREFLEYLYVSDVLQAIRHLHLVGSVTMDIIPPEFALRGSYRHLITAASENNNNSNSTPSSPRQSPKNEDNEGLDEDDLDKTNINRNPNSVQVYHPSFANSILPSTSMSPSWYSASTQKNSFAKWMSPSFYYSRPATSVVLPGANHNQSDDNQNNPNNIINPSASPKGSFIPRDIVTRCLEYRIRRYSPKITPQRMRHVLQRFLKNMVLKANEEV
ncbi:uncharacterized protein BX663DRAFT_526039 [Cokeromyces recurvatus]|uniref:uncharacterized protein n=1 Tax=Cokeromyces recurvatus TaxID=90255 RepID=UPI002220A0C5|nr:uncharacterized protein BX663DRAFT_526039 [Cokeromyces recurvatus]KAI7898059.1 hypothetical protein BX663DRAFT_526039 [Cokeromyces recurvatus]